MNATTKLIYRLPISTLVLLIVATALGTSAHADKRPITAADVIEAEVLSAPALSNSGNWLAYSMTSRSIEKNARDRAVFLISTAGGDTQRMVGSDTPSFSPSWVPGTELLSFLAMGEKGSPQLFRFDPASDKLEQITEVSQAINGYQWSPDGKYLALVLRDDTPVDPRWEGMQPPWVIDRQQFKFDGAGYLDRTRSHIYILDVSSGSLRQLTNGDYDDSSPIWSPDGTQVAFTSNRTANPDGNGDTDVWTISVQPGKPKLTNISASDDMDWSPVWSPDGRYIAYRTYEQPKYFYFSLRKMEVYDLKTGKRQAVAKSLDRSISSPSFSPDSKHLYFVLEDQGSFNLARVAASGKGKPENVTSGNNSIITYDIAANNTIAVRNADYQTPGNYFQSGNMFMLEKTGMRQLTNHNETRYADIEMVDGEPIWYPARDRKKIQGWVYKPANFDANKKYPLIVIVHGGSIMQIGYRFEGMAQVFAANGYVVMLPNYRGSSGYGRKHQLANWSKNYDGKDYRDVADGARHMASLPYINGDRMAVQGWSYGGGVTNKLITKEPKLFAAAISGAGQSLRYGEYGHDQYQAATEKMLGLPWENRKAWNKGAAFHDIANAVTPTMFVVGESDWNVPASHSERMYQAMKRLGRETLLVVYPGQSHMIEVPRYEQHRFEMYLSWYKKHL